MITLQWEFFPALSFPTLKHGLSLRYPRDPDHPQTEEPLLRNSLGGIGLDASIPIARAGQPHGEAVAVLKDKRELYFPQADGLLTALPRVLLAIRIADCAALYLFDPRNSAIGLIHSGKKGTQLKIATKAVLEMNKNFESNPSDLIVQISPCIRFPHYEVDFVSDIIDQLKSCGVEKIFDSGKCTACQLERYFSYRAEKGNTGRMWAVLGLFPQ
ncbi:polyphenol oxidase family protein [Candidatus Methylacidiphilum infernorum]|uniref:polyphenol oxidase family protein n=1 Tax=Candidatus Methylacidiphilum infernorum TaxID=511746 RepID=UPI001F5CFDE5|nr:polyphenol oxidase family protein [Candidatus Methylacidiphilum infernorum]